MAKRIYKDPVTGEWIEEDVDDDSLFYDFDYGDQTPTVDLSDVGIPTDPGYSDTTEEIQDWQNVEGGGNLDNWKYENGVWTDPSGTEYDLSYLNIKDKSTLSKFFGYAKKLLGGKGTMEEYMRLIPGIAGLLAARQSSDPTILNPGYRGGIPQVTATRTMLTEPPAGRRPGSGGINYGGDVTYARTGQNLTPENAGISTPTSQAPGGTPTFTQPAAYDLASLQALIQQLQQFQAQNRPAPAPAPSSGFVSGGGSPAPSPAPSSGFVVGGGSPTTSAAPSAASSSGYVRGHMLSKGVLGFLGMTPEEYRQKLAAAENAPVDTSGFVIGGAQPAVTPAPAPVAPQPANDLQSLFQQVYGRQGADWEMQNLAGKSQDEARQILEASMANMRASQQPVHTANPNQNLIQAARGGLLPDGFVIPADVVSHLGNGSSEAGLELLAEELGAKPIKGEGDGMSDSIPTTIGGKQPARVANEEAFVPPDVVKKLGGGDTERGAKKLYAMMDRIRKARTGTTEQGKQINPEKFMPGGKVDRYSNGGTTTPTSGGSSLAEWVGPYVADMLGKGQALSETPYQAYTGPLTAGASPLQQLAFGTAANLQTPAAYGQAAGIAGGLATLAPNLRYTPQTTDFLGRPNVSGIDVAPSYGMTQQAPMAPQSRQMPAPGGAVADPWDITRSVGHPGFTRIAMQEAAQPGFKGRAPMPPIMDDSGMGPETVGTRPAYGDVIMGPSRYDPVTGMATRDYGPIKPGDSHYDAYFKATYGDQAGGGQKPIQQGIKPPRPEDIFTNQPVIMDDSGMYPGAKPPMISDEFRTVPETFSTMPVDGNLFQITGPDRAPAGDRMPKPDYSTMPVPTGGPTARGLPSAPMPSQQPSNIAQQYMNPYIESVVSPQLRELTRQADIARGADAARMAKAGAFGGSRQAIMEAEGRRNLLERQSDVLGQGYASAYDKAMAQFNADQARRAAEAQFGATYGMEGVRTGLQGAQTLGQLGSQQQQSTIDNLRALAEAGATQRGIEAEGIAADKAQFEEARLNPYKMLQFQQSLLSGLPLAAQSIYMPGSSNLDQFSTGFASVAKLLQYFYPNMFKS